MPTVTALPDSVLTDTVPEVIVTAREIRTASSASLIDTTAMRHLQPSSFTDLLQLLPGGTSVDPAMGRVNTINLRQASGITPTDDYATSALGTAFVVDGVPLATSAEMTATPDGNQAERSSVGRGVDMRSLSTDDIDRVEIVRGIPSAEYGELTSGLVNIKRRSGVSRLSARFKADTQSQLLSLGKGFAMPSDRWIMNVSAAWLDSKIDPRNNRENFKRVTASARSDKRWTVSAATLTWNSALTYIGTFERDDADPDLTVNNTIDAYRNDKHAFAFNNTLALRPGSGSVLREAMLTSGLSYAIETLEQHKHVAPSRIMPLPVSVEEGDNYVGYLPMLYLADYRVEGRPFNSFLRGSARLLFESADWLTNTVKGGVEWNVSKNFGRGPVYDISRPLSAGNNTRPRRFSAIPAIHQLSAYAEDEAKLWAGRHQITLTAGVRTTTLLHLGSRYALNGKPYVDPRLNATWELAPFDAARHRMDITLAGGLGWHTKMPVAAYLYPEAVYTDLEQLNYYHNDERFRTMNVRTYRDDVTNYDLRAARNFKWEVRADLGYRGNRLSVTYFRENMSDGFRQSGYVRPYAYRRYDASAYDPYATGSAPRIEELPYTEAVHLGVRTHTTNGSRTRKEGIEYTFRSKRFSQIHTRLTVTGAYFVTINNNSQALWYKPSVIVGGRELQYVGLYDDTDGSRYESFNTNLLFDTDLPAYNLNFSIGIENMWFTSRRTLRRDGVPVSYVGTDGVIRPFTAQSAADPYLGQLIRQFSSGAFDKLTVPYSATINLKATKSLWRGRIGIAVYVNRLFAFEPDYERYGLTIRRYSSPYFGMELNLKI